MGLQGAVTGRKDSSVIFYLVTGIGIKKPLSSYKCVKGQALYAGALGAIEGFSYLTLVISVGVFALQLIQKGSLPGVTG